MPEIKERKKELKLKEKPHENMASYYEGKLREREKMLERKKERKRKKNKRKKKEIKTKNGKEK